MTFIVAWKTKTEIYITGDSATTRTKFSPSFVAEKKAHGDFTTSFDEPNIYTEERIVEQAVLKIHNIKNKLIVGYSGIGDVAFDVINYLESEINLKSMNVQEIVLEAVEIYGKGIQLVIGFFVHRQPKLLTFNLSGNNEIESPERLIMLGSISAHPILTELTPNLIRFLNEIKQNNTPHDKLIMFTSCMQSIILRAQLINKGIGGFFTGAFLSKNSFCWQRDTGYITFLLNKVVDSQANSSSPNWLFSNSRFIFLFHRENKVALLSLDHENKFKNIQIYQNYLNPSIVNNNKLKYQSEIESWIRRNKKELIRTIKKFNVKYYAFFSYDTTTYNKMTFIRNYYCSSKFVFDIYWRNGFPTLNVTKDFVNDINPIESGALNEFQWLTKTNIFWYIKYFFIYLFKSAYFKIQDIKPKD